MALNTALQSLGGPRVALLGNMNNNHFAVARFLRDRGMDAELLLFDSEQAHFHPSADTYDLDYTEWCHQLGWGEPIRWRAVSDRRIRDDLAPYDILIGCGMAPAFAHRIGRRMDVFVPYGADLLNGTEFRLTLPNRIPSVWAAVASQRRGIREAHVFQMDETNQLFESLWRRYAGNESARWRFGPPMVHTGTYNPEAVRTVADRTHWAHVFEEVRTSCDIMLMYHARHVWGGPADDPNQKGTDRLLRGLSLFRERNPDVKIRLVTLEYGDDVLKSRALLSELGLDDVVVWLPRMLRKDLMIGVLLSDVVCGEFQHSWLSSGVVYEAQSMGTPILAYRDDALYEDAYDELYPMMNGRAPEEICQRLDEFRSDPARHEAMGATSRAWYEREVVDRALDHYCAYVDRAAKA